MELLIAPQPTIHAFHATARAADEPVHAPDDLPHVPEFAEAQAAAESARARHAELEGLLRVLADLTDALAALAAEPVLDPDALLEQKARIDALRAEMDLVQARIDLAAVYIDQADTALAHSIAELKASVAQTNVDWLSHRGMFEDMANAIENIQNGFVKETQVATQRFLEFFRGYAEIRAKLNEAIKADTAKDKEGYVIVTFDDLRAEYYDFWFEWEHQGLGTFSSEAAAERFLIDTGLIEMDFPIRQVGGQWQITLPLHVVEAERNSMPPEPWETPPNPRPPNYVPKKADPISWNNAVYQAWLSGSNGRQEGLQNNSRTLVERLNRVNQIFDNLNNLLSESKKAVDDADRQVAHNL